MAKASGAITVAMVNDTASPLAAASDIVLPIGAGPEHSVAATKTFVASLAALLRLTAAWTEDAAFRHSARSACRTGWRRPPILIGAPRSARWPKRPACMTLGRGPTLAIAREAALKFKETCDLPAEPFSGAEFMHGPVSLVDTHYPVLICSCRPTPQRRDWPSSPPTWAAKAHRSSSTGRGEGSASLPSLSPEHPDADAICLIQSLYGLLVTLGRTAGHQCRPAAASAESHANAMSDKTTQAVAADHIFDGISVRHNAAVLIEGEDIARDRASRGKYRAIRPSTRCLKEHGSLPVSSTCR